MESCLRYLERKMRELLSPLPFSKWQNHAGIFIIISYAGLPSRGLMLRTQKDKHRENIS